MGGVGKDGGKGNMKSFIADWIIGMAVTSLLLNLFTAVPGLQILSAALMAGLVFALIKNDMDLYDG